MSSSIRGLISCLRRPRISLCQIRELSGGRQVSPPWLMLPPSFEKEGGGGGMSYNFYSLAEKKLVSLKKKSEAASESPDDDALFVGSSHGWLALYNHRGDGRLFLSNPITGENIRLPPPQPDTDYLNHLSERERKREREEECLVRKVVLSSRPHREGCRAMMTFFTGHLALCGPGRCTTWQVTIGWSSQDFEFVDVVYSPTEKLFFGLIEVKYENEDEGEGEDELDLVEWGAFNSYPFSLEEENRYSLDEFSHNKHNYPFFARSTQERAELKKRFKRRRTCHLVHVEHADQLLLVKRRVVEHKTIGFDVHVIDRRRHKLRYMEGSLDGLVLFVGVNHSLAVRAAEFPELKPDSIYFTDGEPFVLPEDGGHDIGIFDYKERTVLPCYYPCDYGSINKIYPSPLWNLGREEACLFHNFWSFQNDRFRPR